MDNHQNQRFFPNRIEFAHALQNLWRGIVSPQQDNDTDMSEMPPLEPLDPHSNTFPVMDHSDMPPLEPLGAHEDHAPYSTNTNNAIHTLQSTPVNGDDDEGSMPDLESVSDSDSDGESSGRDVDEVEMMQDLQPVEDDNDSAWTDEEDGHSGIPRPQPTPRTNRRARVDDDEDEDRDRRHPSERTGETQGPRFPHIDPPRNALPFPFARFPAFPPNQDLFRSFQHPGNPTGATQPQPINPSTSTNAGTPQDQPPPQHPNLQPNRPRRVFTTGIAFLLDANGNTLAPPQTFGDNHGHPQPQPQPHGHPHAHPIPLPFDFRFAGPPPPGNPEDVHFRAFTEMFEHFGANLQAMGFGAEEQEDPERAKKLVAGLEEVPIGLVRRLERVGGAPGAHVDDSTGEVDVPGCAICWDKLLDVEGDGFEVKEDQSQAQSGSDDLTASGVEPSSSASQPTTAVPVVPEQPKIVCLPCAHVFHATCLIPWFSRPRQSTCPTCRFNIDPENLTYVRRPRPQPTSPNQPRPTTGTGTAAEDAPSDPGVLQHVAIPPESDVNPPAPAAEGAAEPTPASAPINDQSDRSAAPDGNPRANAEERPNAQHFFTMDFNITIGNQFGPVVDEFFARRERTEENNEQGVRMEEQAFPHPLEFLDLFPPEARVRFGIPPRSQSSHARERKEWAPPAPPGPSLRQRVEKNERDQGLRCFDISCGIGPSDEDPFPDVLDASMKQLLVKPLKASAVVSNSVCAHTFHPACLVSAERVAGWGGEDKPEVDDDVEVSCPVCRAVGCVSKEEWKEGVKTLV